MNRSTVAIWKTGWLPSSEVFIRDQVNSLRRWNAIRVGLFPVPNVIDEQPNYTPYSGSFDRTFLRKALGARPFINEYTEYLKAHDTRVIHAHFGSGGLISLPIAKRAKIPHVVTFHGQDSSRYGTSRTYLDGLYRNRLRRMFDHSAIILAVSSYVAEDLVRIGAPKEKVIVHYTGVPVPTDSQLSTRRTGLLFVGRLVPKKGVADLLRALTMLGSAAPPTTIIGDGPLRQELEAMCRINRLTVHFAGWRSPNEVKQAMREHAIFCAPSRSTLHDRAEGFGMVYVEAALASLPVVAYEVGGTKEATLAGETSLLAAEGDIRGLADRIFSLTTNLHLSQRLGEAGRRRAIERFDVLVQTSLLEDLYESVV